MTLEQYHATIAILAKHSRPQDRRLVQVARMEGIRAPLEQQCAIAAPLGRTSRRLEELHA